MAASNSQAELDTMGDDHLEDDQELAAAARSAGEDATTGDQEVNPKPQYECPHCSKSYKTKKSLTRHLSSTDTVCAKQRLSEAQASEGQLKPRWACSRCGKDCATSHSVDRHINNSCWRSCDECAADGVTRCDSVTKAGPCRTCEAKERSCTKHTSAIPGTTPQPWTGPATQLQRQSPAVEEAASTSEQKAAKRKTPASPKTSPEGAHKNKRKAPAGLPVVDHGLGRVYDPLGGQAYVPPMAKKTAVSDWLQEQLNKSSTASSAQDHAQHYSPLLTHISSMQNHHAHQLPDQFVKPSHVFGRALPSSASFLPSHHGNSSLTFNHGQTIPLSRPSRTYQTLGHGSTVSPHSSSIPDLPSLGGAPQSTAGGPVQLDRLFLQMQATRQQNEAHNFDMARRFGPRNGTILPPPFGLSGSLDLSGQDTAQAQGAPATSSLQTLVPGNLSRNDSAFTLRIHSNTHDKNGLPIFSILRIRRDEIFGPRLDAYCANRGKEYGVHWMFVYRYQAATHQNPGQELQITLTWDMTPNDVKDADFPGIAMRDLDTIYVMKSKPSASAETDREMKEGGAVQSPGPQVSYEEVNITNGETNAYQNPDVSRQWYEAIEQDSNRLRASQGTMKSTIVQQQQQIFAKNKEIVHQQRVIDQLTTLSRQFRERMQNPFPDPTVHLPGPLALQAPASRVVGQRSGAPQPQPAQQRSNAGPNAFVAKCEAVRDAQDQAPQHLEPLQFPSFTGGFEIPNYAHQPNMDAAHNAQIQNHGRIHDAADKVAAESGVQKMDEE